MKGWCDFSFLLQRVEELEKENKLLKRRKKRWTAESRPPIRVSFMLQSHTHTQSIWRKEHEDWKDVWLAWRAGLVLFDAQEGLCAEVGRERQKLHWISVEECDTAALPAQLKADHCIKPVHMWECYLKPEVWYQDAFCLLNVALTSLSRTYFPQCCSAVEAV